MSMYNLRNMLRRTQTATGNSPLAERIIARLKERSQSLGRLKIRAVCREKDKLERLFSK